METLKFIFLNELLIAVYYTQGIDFTLLNEFAHLFSYVFFILRPCMLEFYDIRKSKLKTAKAT